MFASDRCRFRVAALLAIVVAASSRLIAAEPPATILGDAVDGTPVGQLLTQRLLDDLRPHFTARRKAIAAIDSPEKLLQRRAWIRETLARINGPFPERTPLHPRVMGTLSRDGYRIEKVVFESRPGQHVTGNVYVPADTNGRLPGVIVPCGHSSNGKAAATYQSVAISLAKRGMIALVYDPIGQGERHQLLGPDGKSAIQGVSEHNQIGIGSWLVGLGTANHRIWDGLRALDYLASRPDVDPSRLGCTGNSGGGTLTSFLMAFDDRIVAAAPSCYLTTFERLFDTIGPQDAEQNFPGQVALGLDHADFILARAPQPTLMCVAIQDFFDVGGARTTFREAKSMYDLLGHGDRMQYFEFDDKHGFSAPRREAAMRFLRRQLLGLTDDPAEGELQLATDAELQVTKSGEVLAEFDDGVSVFALNRQRARDLAPQRERSWKTSPDDAKKSVAASLGLRDAADRGAVQSKLIRTDLSADGKTIVERLVIRDGSGFPLPARLLRPKSSDGTTRLPATIVVSDRGAHRESQADGEATRLAADGRIVLAVDLRGFGETQPSLTGKYGDHPKGQYTACLLALHANRPLLGQRVEDLLAAVAALAARTDVATDRIDVVGIGLAGPVALHAAVFEPRIAGATLVDSIRSWMDVLDLPLERSHLESVVPFALERYDLSDLAKSVAPRRVVWTESKSK